MTSKGASDVRRAGEEIVKCVSHLVFITAAAVELNLPLGTLEKKKKERPTDLFVLPYSLLKSLRKSSFSQTLPRLLVSCRVQRARARLHGKTGQNSRPVRVRGGSPRPRQPR